MLYTAVQYITMSETEEATLTPDEVKNIVSALESLKMKPKADSPEDFIYWMKTAAKLSEKTSADVAGRPVETSSAASPSPQFIKISFFSGDSKSDASYDVWRYEVECLLNESYKPETISHAIRRSLKGEASRVVMHLGAGASTRSILDKLDSIYGTVAEREDILAEFYSARQREDEECARWSCRLEDIISKAQQKGLVQTRECDEMLRTMFFKGLRPSLKDICGHLYDKSSTFDSLRAAVRKVEMEHQPPMKKSAITKSATPKEEPDDRFQSLEAKINQLTTEIRGMKDRQYSYNYRPMPQARQPYQRGRQNQGYRGGYRQYPSSQQPNKDTEDAVTELRDSRARDPPTCYKCGQVGHVAIGCRVLVNHRRQGLNFNRSTPGDEGLTRGQRVPGNRH